LKIFEKDGVRGFYMQYVPYILDEDEGDYNLQEEHEVALALLIALSREQNVQPSAIVKAHYPLRVYRKGGENIIFDLLGFSESEKKWLIPKDISMILDQCACTDDNEGLRNWLKEGKKVLEEEPEYESILVEGLIEQVEMREYILDTKKEKKKDQNELFQPLLTSKRFSSIKKEVKKVHSEVEQYLDLVIYTKNRAEAQESVIQENQENEFVTFQRESSKRLETFENERKKAIKKIDKALKKDKKAIEDEIHAQLELKSREIDEIKNEMIILLERLESGEKNVKRLISEKEKLIKKIIKEQKALEEELVKSLSKAETEAESEKLEWEEKHSTLMKEEEKLLEDLKNIHELTWIDIRELVDKIKEVEMILSENIDCISKILDIQYGKGKDILIPFYVFKYAEDRYGFYPPFKIVEAKSMMNKLRGIISNSLGSKLSQHISPQTMIFNDHMEKVINSLNEGSELFDEFMDALPKANLLESQVILDKMVVGLYQILDWGWIKGKDYVEVQGFIAEKMDSLYGGNIFKAKEEPMDPHSLAPETVEISASP
jgi:hypothetical protein